MRNFALANAKRIRWRIRELERRMGSGSLTTDELNQLSCDRSHLSDVMEMFDFSVEELEGLPPDPNIITRERTLAALSR